jgi:hypothetical protein
MKSGLLLAAAALLIGATSYGQGPEKAAKSTAHATEKAAKKTAQGLGKSGGCDGFRNEESGRCREVHYQHGRFPR